MKVQAKDKILVTGCAGFVGMHLCHSLLKDGFFVYGVDNMNTYYEKSLKFNRLKNIDSFPNFEYSIVDLRNLPEVQKIFRKFGPQKVVNLAAQAGVQYSIKNPHTYIHSNVEGFLNILECSKEFNSKGLIYASSSSVYGSNKEVPFSESDITDYPISVYAATKKSNELMANVYNDLYNLNVTGLRFFTVYGPWGRPDMAYFSFTDKIINDKVIEVYDNGKVERDFTYIDDIVTGIRSAINKNFENEIFNLGNNKKERVITLIKIIENRLGKKAQINLKPLRAGDVVSTNADLSKSNMLLNYSPKIDMIEGINSFIDWYLDYYNL